jgi:hypothetical protein
MTKNFEEKKWVNSTGHVRTTHEPKDEVKLRAAGYTPFEDNAPEGTIVDPKAETVARLAEINAHIVELDEKDDAEEIAQLQEEIAAIASANPELKVDLVNGAVEAPKKTPRGRR